MKKSYLLLLAVYYVIFANVNLAQTWTQQSSGTFEALSGIHMLSGSEGWVCGDGGTLLHTTNSGNSWLQVNITNEDIGAVVFNNQIGIVVGDNGIIYRTSNNGANWNARSSGTGSQLRSVSWTTGNTVFAAGRDGASVVSTDAGDTWTSLNTGTAARFRGCASFADNLWAVGEDGVLMFSANLGQSWSSQNSGVNDDLHDAQFLNENTGFAGGSGSNIIFTDNSGQTWVNRSTGIAMGINGIYFLDQNIGWAASDDGIVYTTTNAGLNWLVSNTGTNEVLDELFYINQGLGWAVGENGTITKFEDSSLPVELTSFTCNLINKEVNLSWQTGSEINNKGFLVERISLSGQGNSWVELGFVEGKGSTTEKQVYNYIDRSVVTGTYQYRLNQIDFNGQNHYSGIIEINTGNIISNFTLSQNYPNPFNPATKIKYEIPFASGGKENIAVALKVYDVLGKEVAVVVNEQKSPGIYEVEFDASQLVSGIYLYTLQIGGNSVSKKMTLLK